MMTHGEFIFNVMNRDIDFNEEIWSFFNRFIDSANADINQDGQVNIQGCNFDQYDS